MTGCCHLEAPSTRARKLSRDKKTKIMICEEGALGFIGYRVKHVSRVNT